MRRLLVFLMLSSGFLLAQSNSPGAADQNKSDGAKNQVTMQGCVDRERGDYILVQQNPAATWELQGTGKIKVSKYFGQQVEVTGRKVTSLPTSSDSMTNSSAPSPVTILVSSVKVLDKSCTARPVK